MGVIIYPDGRTEERAPANGRYYQLGELQAIVGGYIEMIGLDTNEANQPMLMILNEDGRRLGLPHNEAATKMAALPSPREQYLAVARLRQSGLRAFIYGTLEEANQIVGTVLVCERKEVE